MKKILTMALVVSSLCAANNSEYIGLGVGSSEFTVDTVNTITNSGVHGTIVLGKNYGDYGRFYASGTYINSSDSVDTVGVYSLAYDFIFPVADDIFSLYVGPVAGYTTYKEQSIDLSGAHYGAETGVTVDLDETFELELGYRYLVENGKEGVVSAKSMQQIYFQVNIYFDGSQYFKYE